MIAVDCSEAHHCCMDWGLNNVNCKWVHLKSTLTILLQLIQFGLIELGCCALSNYQCDCSWIAWCQILCFFTDERCYINYINRKYPPNTISISSSSWSYDWIYLELKKLKHSLGGDEAVCLPAHVDGAFLEVWPADRFGRVSYIRDHHWFTEQQVQVTIFHKLLWHSCQVLRHNFSQNYRMRKVFGNVSCNFLCKNWSSG